MVNVHVLITSYLAHELEHARPGGSFPNFVRHLFADWGDESCPAEEEAFGVLNQGQSVQFALRDAAQGLVDFCVIQIIDFGGVGGSEADRSAAATFARVAVDFMKCENYKNSHSESFSHVANDPDSRMLVVTESNTRAKPREYLEQVHVNCKCIYHVIRNSSRCSEYHGVEEVAERQSESDGVSVLIRDGDGHTGTGAPAARGGIHQPSKYMS